LRFAQEISMSLRPNPFARRLHPSGSWGPDPHRTVLEVAQKSPSLVSPETTAEEARRVATRAGVHHLAVVSEQGEPLGVVCKCALLAAPRGVTVADCMRAPAITINAECSPEEASAVMLERGVGCLPVLYEFTVVGVVTRGELVGAGALSAAVAPRCTVCNGYDHIGPQEKDESVTCRRCRQAVATGQVAKINPDADPDELAFGD
jgi:CBS domain-containing protein